MQPTVIRYTTKPDQTDRNTQLVEGVFSELAARTPAGVRYAVLRLDDGTFIHLADVDGDGAALTGLPAFQAFLATGDERRVEPPVRGEATVVGNYRMFA